MKAEAATIRAAWNHGPAAGTAALMRIFPSIA